MTEPLEPRGITRECLHCGIEFVPRKAGHVFHSRECRHRGALAPELRRPVDPDAVARLFDESRDPGERVRPDDWHPGPPEFVELDAVGTVGGRRLWYRNLQRLGRL